MLGFTTKSKAESPIYRVYAEGLTTVERTVLNGLLRMSRQRGIDFQIDGSLENAAVIILDGAARGDSEFAQSLNHARRVIWIDPPSHIRSGWHVRRPLRWPVLLQLMEQIAGVAAAPVEGLAVALPVRLTLDQLCRIGEDVLRPHIGIAAQFIVEDVRAEMEKDRLTGEAVAPNVFIAAVRLQLPSNVDADKITQELSTMVTTGANG